VFGVTMKYEVLAVYASSPGHCADEAYLPQPCFTISTFIRSSCTKKQETNPYFYKLLQSQISLTALNYCYISTAGIVSAGSTIVAKVAIAAGPAVFCNISPLLHYA